MVEELGRITRPATANYQGKRKLLLAPLIHLAVPADSMPPEGAEILARYWDQVDVQVRAVQNALGSVTHVYHENLPEGGNAGLGYLEVSGQGSHKLTAGLVEAGAVLETTESMAILAETLDLQRCLMQPLMSPDVAGSAPGMVRRSQSPALRIRRRCHRHHAGRRRNGPAADQRAPSGPVSRGYRGDLHRPARPGRVPALAAELERTAPAGNGQPDRRPRRNRRSRNVRLTPYNETAPRH